MEAPKGNVKNPAIRRIHADIRELQHHPTDQYHAVPLEENLFEWHFTIRGPSGTDFEGGIYHGRILLPADYPFKPPNIILLTPNGRFEVGKKICLSISAYHPEHWQPAWGIRLILEALISFLPTDPNGAVGSLDWTPEERRRLAKDSVAWTCSRCGELTSILPEVEKKEGEGEEGAKPSIYAEEIAKMYIRAPSGEGEAAGTGGESASPALAAATQRSVVPSSQEEEMKTPGGTTEAGQPQQEVASVGRSPPATAPAPAPRLAPAPIPAPAPTNMPGVPRPAAAAAPLRAPATVEEEEDDDDKLLYLAMALFVAIVALVVRKVMRAYNAEA